MVGGRVVKGKNTLTLNTATMIEALQEYFDKRLSPKIKVETVASAGNPGYTSTFTVDVSEVVDTP